MIPHVPDEILFEIFSCLPCQDLARVSLVARRLHCISQPLLYKQPELKDRANQRPSSIQAFIRTLLTTGCESLANNVRHLTISWRELPVGPISTDYATLKIAASSFGLGDWPFTDDIHIMLLLHLLPSLNTLHLYPVGVTHWFRNLPHLHSHWQPQNPIPPGLLSLREFRCDFQGCVRPRPLAFLLALPHLRSLALPICGEVGLALRGSAIPIPRSSDVTSLEFNYARMSHSSLKSILTIPRALTHFYYRGMRSTNLIGFHRALAPLRESLQTLVLDFSAVDVERARGMQEGQGEEDAGVSLRDWTALRNVAVSLVVLVGIPEMQPEPAEVAELLPPGITMLRLLKDGFWTESEATMALVAMLGRKEVMVPRLESVGLWERVEGEVAEKLRDVCASTRVQILGAGADLGRVFATTRGEED